MRFARSNEVSTRPMIVAEVPRIKIPIVPELIAGWIAAEQVQRSDFARVSEILHLLIWICELRPIASGRG